MEETKRKYYTTAVKKAIYKYRETHKDVQAAVYARWKIKNAEESAMRDKQVALVCVC